MEVKCATSFDERFDPNNVLNKDPKKFWVTTGLYPHELLIDLGGTKPINDVKFTSTGIKKVIIEGCKTTNASEFKKVGESKELTNKSGVQNDSVRLTDPAPYCLIKFVIQEGYDDFSSVHNIEFA
eukprot:403336504